MAALAVCPTGAVAEVYSCEIKEWVRVNDEGLVRPAPSAPFKRQVSIDKETGNAVGDALSAANRCEIAQKGSQENAFMTLGYVGSRLLYEITVYEFKKGREKPRCCFGATDRVGELPRSNGQTTAWRARARKGDRGG